MKYYIELTIIDSQELTLYQIWSKLYIQLHLAFVVCQDQDGKVNYGVSFPQYRMVPDKKISSLGQKVRIFAQSQQALQALDLPKWLERLTDYVHISSIRAVPADKVTGYAQFYRAMPQMSLEERIIHQAKRHQVPIEQARVHLQNYDKPTQSTPYILLKSLSSEKNFALHIAKRSVKDVGDGCFGTYGLSRSAGVPEF